jgi:sec-independent protein translocase protein TatA
MLGGLGAGTIVLIILVALLLFGPSKLPELGRAFGRTLNEFKKGAKDVMSDDEEEDRKEIKQSQDKKEEDKEKKNNDNRRLPD